MNEDLLREIASISSNFPEALLEPVCLDLDGMVGDLDANGSMAALRPIAHAHLSHRLRSLFQIWKRAAPELPPSALSCAMRACQVANRHLRQTASLEPVWTGPAATPAKLRRTEQALVETIRTAASDLWFVSFAAYSVPSIRDALRDAVDRDVMVRFVVEDPEESGGKIDHSVSKALGKNLEGRLRVLVWPKERRKVDDQGNSGVLHVKCALADDKKLFVTSANLTGHAMNLNMELGLLVEGGPIPRQLKSHLEWLAASKTIVPALS